MSPQLCPPMDILPLVAGRRVAIVGHAQSLIGESYGQEIDAADVVVRFHGKRVFDDREEDLGARVNLWYTGRSLLPPVIDGVPVCGKKPDLLELIRHYWNPVMPRKHIFNPQPDTPSFTGVVAIFDCLLSSAAWVSVYGCDFFRTPDLDTGEALANRPHLRQPGIAACIRNDLRRLRTIMLDGCSVSYDRTLLEMVLKPANQLPERKA